MLTVTTAAAYVEVNESWVLQTRCGHEWWILYSQRFHGTDRIEVVHCTIGGAVVRVACEDRGHAQWLAGQMLNVHGLPKKAVKVGGPRSGDAS